ncbi:MAG: hypothetical protein KAR20_26740, partial [Candidatus Heimdallarchaeota archaeon]|nr:hypothetical protein [Candidatus Heimdallarchaeota archaeon]
MSPTSRPVAQKNLTLRLLKTVTMLIRLFIVSVFVILLSSCTSQKKLIYLENLDTIPHKQFFEVNDPIYRIHKRDILYIRFFTMNQELNDILNLASTRYTSNLYQNETSLYINGYTVNDSGLINIPL